MSNQNAKRSRNDERRQHVEKRTGEKHKHRIEQEKINEADKSIRDFCCTVESSKDSEDQHPN